jgi:mannose-6-phosphate isomerase
MANSDNVIRAGLTPKLRDLPNLLAGLTYASGPPAQHAVQPAPFPPCVPADRVNTSTMLYDPPAPEFSVLRTTVRPGSVEKHRALDGPSIALVLAGRGLVRWTNGDGAALNVSFGHVFFVGAGTEVYFEVEAETVAGVAQELVVYRAFVEV